MNRWGSTALSASAETEQLKQHICLSQEGLNVVGIPKTIDNDVWGTDLTFGFDSAVNIATEAIDRLHSTANSHKRIMIIEVMGHNAGWIALYSGIAGGGDVILIPEIQYNDEKIAEYLLHRVDENKPYSIVVVAEGIKKPVKERCSAAQSLSKRINELTGLKQGKQFLDIYREEVPHLPWTVFLQQDMVQQQPI